MKILKSVLPETARGGGEGLLVVDDLADTGATVKIVRAILPKAHVATVYAKPLGRPFVDTFITEVSQDTWIHFLWDSSAQVSGADRRAWVISQFEYLLPTLCGSSAQSSR